MPKNNDSQDNLRIKLNESQRNQVLGIFSRGVVEATFHIRKILFTGRNLYTRYGTNITASK